jgi:HAD superfamily hydrolase (TIGR01509 family)
MLLLLRGLLLLLSILSCARALNQRRLRTGLFAIKPSSYDLVVWDCDGVLVDSEALLKQGEVEELHRLGFTGLTVDDATRLFSGVSTDQAEANFKKEMNVALPSDFFRKQIAQSMDLFRQRLRPLMANTVLELHANNIPMCVASGSPRDRVLLCLEVAGIRQCFPDDAVFTRELVQRGKPAPDLFLYAAEKMGNVPPARCIVIEDAGSGIEAANAANMPVIGFLGAGHAQASWYRSKIESYKIPLTYTQEEVLSKLSSL